MIRFVDMNQNPKLSPSPYIQPLTRKLKKI